MADEYLEGIMKKVRTRKSGTENAVNPQPTAAPNPSVQIARPASEWHEDMGDVLWWYVKDGVIQEEPWVGTPLTFGQTVEAHTTTRVITQLDQDHDPEPVIHRIHVGGWPGYHTHFTHIVKPIIPRKAKRGNRAKTSKC